jgi:hypothetical protein
MRGSYRRIPIWELRRRLALLRRFSELVVKYDETADYSTWGGGQPIDNDESTPIRHDINLILHDVSDAVMQAGINPTLTAMGGGGGYNIDLIGNVFGLHEHHIPIASLIDYVTRAIGKYQGQETWAWVRTFNPFFWVGLLFDAVVSVPFALARRAGFDTRSAEASVVGRVWKLAGWLLTATATTVTLLQAFGWLDAARSAVTHAIRGV